MCMSLVIGLAFLVMWSTAYAAAKVAHKTIASRIRFWDLFGVILSQGASTGDATLDRKILPYKIAFILVGVILLLATTSLMSRTCTVLWGLNHGS